MEFLLEGKRVFAGTGGRGFAAALPTSVLLHGAGLDHTIWALQARALAHHGRNVLALDLPGHGRSEGPPRARIDAMAEWVLAVLAARGVTRFRLAGHSMGALVAFAAAARAGDRVESLALLGFAPEMRVHPALLAAARDGAHAAVEFMVSWGLGAASQLGGNPAPGLWLTGAALRLLERAPAASLAADLAACDGYNAGAEATVPACPTLLLLGADDRMTPPEAAIAFARRLPQARITVLPGVGHLMPIEAPGATLAALKSAL
ncbi:MAG TPA: alpha/beta hydrolase [Stellaceae bacterium]|nr:alpha/beta hydrolase [Stellaceae bacterium]